MISDDSHGFEKCRGRRISKSLPKEFDDFICFISIKARTTNKCAKTRHFGLPNLKSSQTGSAHPGLHGAWTRGPRGDPEIATWCHRDCVDDTTSNTWSDDFFHHFLGDLGDRVQVCFKICSDSDLGVLKLCIPQKFQSLKKQILTLHQFLFPWKSFRCYEFLRDIYICEKKIGSVRNSSGSVSRNWLCRSNLESNLKTSKVSSV